MRRLILILLLLFTDAGAQAATVVYVSATATGANDGSNWANACTTLQGGLARAGSGDQVWVAQGTYVPGTLRSDTFTIPDGVAVYGGFIGSETALSQRQDDPGLVILCGEIGAPGYADNTERLVTLAKSGRLDTVTVTMANFDGASLYDGAGLLASTAGADVAVVRCRFRGNRAFGPQVIYIANAASAEIDRCEITDSAEIDSRTQFVGTVTFDSCTAVTMTRSVVADVRPMAAADSLQAVLVRGFSLSTGPRGLIANCIFVNCQCSYALYAQFFVTVEGSIFVGNKSYNNQAGDFRGCILEPTAEGNTLSFPNVDENNWITSVDGDPQFTNRAALAGADGVWFTGDDGLRLQPTSPCIDHARFTTATSTTAMPQIDILGTPRPQGRYPDCGAYEFPTGNAGPIAISRTEQVREDILTPLALSGTDADGNALTSRVLSLPTRGELLPTVDGVIASGPALGSGDLPYTATNASGIVLFRTAADTYGSAYTSFTYLVNDGQVDSDPATVAIDVLSVNDAPTIDPVSNLSILEGSGQTVVPLTGISAGTPNLPIGDPNREVQVLAISATSSDSTLIGDPTISYTSPNPTAALVFTPLAEANGTATITVTIHDNGGTAHGGVDTTVLTFQVVVQPVNDPPRLTVPPSLTMPEDQPTNLACVVSGAGPPNEDPQIPAMTLVATAVDPTLITILGVDWDHQIGAATVHLAPVSNANGHTRVAVTLIDDGRYGDLPLAATQICDVTVIPVDDPPTLIANPGLIAMPNKVTGITTVDLQASDPDATPTASFVFTVTTVPGFGAIRLAGSALPVGGTFTQADIDAGRLSYASTGGSLTDTWSFTWSDGTTPSQGPATMAVTLLGSTLPTLTVPASSLTWFEHTSPLAVAPAAVVTDPDAVPWDGGSISATISGNDTTGDILDLANQGVGANQVSLQGADVLVGNTKVGTLSGGAAGTPLTIALSGSNASPASAQAIVHAIRFANQGGNPGALKRIITLVVNDGAAGASAPAAVGVQVVPVNDAPVITTPWLSLPAGAAITTRLTASDPDGPSQTWKLVTTPTLADVTLEDASSGRLRIAAHPSAAGSGILRVRVDDGVAAPVEADLALVISASGDARPEPAGELPSDTHAGGEIDSIIRFDTAGLGGTAGLVFSTSADAPPGLVLTATDVDHVRVHWSVPAATPAPSYVRFAIIATDPASRSSGLLPVLLLVRPQPGGGG